MEKNTSDAPKRFLDRKNAFVAALHVLVLAVSLAIHSPIAIGTDTALP